MKPVRLQWVAHDRRVRVASCVVVGQHIRIIKFKGRIHVLRSKGAKIGSKREIDST